MSQSPFRYARERLEVAKRTKIDTALLGTVELELLLKDYEALFAESAELRGIKKAAQAAQQAVNLWRLTAWSSEDDGDYEGDLLTSDAETAYDNAQEALDALFNLTKLS